MSEPLHPASSPGFLLWQVTHAWQRQVVAALKPFGLTHAQFVLLVSTWWLTEHEQAPTQRRIAEHAGTDPMMTSQVLRSLEGKGLLTRQPSNRDARANTVAPTANGADLARAATAAVEAVDLEFFQTTTHTDELVEALNELAQSHQRHS